MNGRMSRFLRRFATATGKDYRRAKKAWTGLPRNQRATVKAKLAEEIE